MTFAECISTSSGPPGLSHICVVHITLLPEQEGVVNPPLFTVAPSRGPTKLPSSSAPLSPCPTVWNILFSFSRSEGVVYLNFSRLLKLGQVPLQSQYPGMENIFQSFKRILAKFSRRCLTLLPIHNLHANRKGLLHLDPARAVIVDKFGPREGLGVGLGCTFSPLTSDTANTR